MPPPLRPVTSTHARRGPLPRSPSNGQGERWPWNVVAGLQVADSLAQQIERGLDCRFRILDPEPVPAVRRSRYRRSPAVAAGPDLEQPARGVSSQSENPTVLADVTVVSPADSCTPGTRRSVTGSRAPGRSSAYAPSILAPSAQEIRTQLEGVRVAIQLQQLVNLGQHSRFVPPSASQLHEGHLFLPLSAIRCRCAAGSARHGANRNSRLKSAYSGSRSGVGPEAVGALCRSLSLSMQMPNTRLMLHPDCANTRMDSNRSGLRMLFSKSSPRSGTYAMVGLSAYVTPVDGCTESSPPMATRRPAPTLPSSGTGWPSRCRSPKEGTSRLTQAHEVLQHLLVHPTR